MTLALLFVFSAQAAGAAVPPPLPPLRSGAGRVYFVRHGQALSNLRPAPKVANLDTLTDLGKEQSKVAGAALRSSGAAMILTSPAGRAQETAAELAPILSLTPSIDERLRPLTLGTKEDGVALSFDERAKAWEAGKDPSVTAGESLQDVGVRLANVVCGVRGKSSGIAVAVSHSEAIQALIVHAKKEDAWKAWPPRVANGSVTVAECDAKGVVTLAIEGFVPGGAK